MGIKTLYRSHFTGPGGINAVIPIALPMVISQASDTLMMFTDRLFLARLSAAHLSAAMSGGITAFMMMTFFSGLLGYINALVAQYYGAGRKSRCAVASSQGLIVAFLAYPVVLGTIPLGRLVMTLFAHDPVQQALELEYFNILMFGAVIALVRVVLASFFSGIGRTAIVMTAHLVAMVVNIVANYVLIFGNFGCPALGMKGAAIGTLMGSSTAALILAVAYFNQANQRRYQTRSSLRLDRDMMKRFLRFGAPGGLEFLLNIAAFNIMIQALHSYGRQVAAAVTITFNWDMVSFVPLIGINIATMSLVGRHMGAKNPDLAERSAYSGMKLAYSFTGLLVVLFILTPTPLIRLFAANFDPQDAEVVIPMAATMLRLASIYLLADATFLVFGGALRGAGDTRWAMWASVTLHWLLAGTGLVTIRVLHLPPLTVWTIFVFMVCLIGSAFYLRFRNGFWKTIQVVEEPPIEQLPRPIDGPALPEML